MINILTSSYDFGEGELREKLLDYIKDSMKVVVIPFSHSQQKMPTISEYDRYCNKGGEYYELIAEQFSKLGVSDSNIDIVHYYNDDLNAMKRKISSSDVIFLTGGLPDKAMERIREKGLFDIIKSFKGIVMGASAGALIQLPEYFCTPDKDYTEFSFYKGLGLTSSDFYIEVHYEGSPLKNEFPILKEKNKIIYAISDESGLIYNGDNIEVIGNVIKIDD